MIFQLDVPIYETNILFIIEPIKEEMDEFLGNEKNRERLTDDEFESLFRELDDTRYGGYTTSLDKGGYLVLLKQNYKDPFIYQHELFHVMNLIMYDREIEYSKTSEPHAYLIGWITMQYLEYINSQKEENS